MQQTKAGHLVEGGGETAAAMSFGSELTLVARLRMFYFLCKPRITFLVLFSAFAGIWTCQTIPVSMQLVWVLLGISLATASGAVLNNYVDRKRDARMQRTQKRRYAIAQLGSGQVLFGGIVLAVLSAAILALGANLLCMLLTLATILTYVILYTAWLKRTTPWGVVAGGIAGAAPPVLGAVGVSGDITPGSILLFSILFVWQPAHFWFLAAKYQDDYKRGGFPMLPLVRSSKVFKLHVLLWNLLLFPVSLLPFFLAEAGFIYLIPVVILNLMYIKKTISYTRKTAESPDHINMFLFSVLYLSLLFLLFVIDRI